MRKMIVFLLLAISLPLVAQEAPPPPQAILKEVLQLDDAQLKSLGDLMDRQRAAVEPLAAQMGQAQQALGNALNAATPDPTAVGTALLAVRNLQRQVEQRHREFADGFVGLLTDAQKQQVQNIRGVEGALHAAQALHALGL